MSLITRTYTFTDGTTAYGSQVDAEIANIVNTINNLDSAGTTWTNVKVTTLLPQADVNVGGHRLTNIAAPVSNGDAIILPVTASVISNNTIVDANMAANTLTHASIASQTIRGSTANSGGSAQEVNQGTISTPDLRTNAVTLSSNACGTSNSTDLATTANTISITTIGKPVLILATVRAIAASDGSKSNIQICVTCDTAAITPHNFETATIFSASSQVMVVPMMIYHTPSAASHSYKLTYTSNGGALSSVIYDFTVIEMRA